MQTFWIGQEEFIKYDGRTYRKTEASADAAASAESCKRILDRENVQFPNGRMSHEAAGEELEKAEDILLDYLCITVS